LAGLLCACVGPHIWAQQPAAMSQSPAVLQASAESQQAVPIAIVRLDSKLPGGAPKVSGALEVDGNRAMIAASGTVTAGKGTALILLPRRGELRLCATTTVKLAADATVSVGAGLPGLLLALDHGALELSLANTAASRNSDLLMTPDFRILISGPGSAEVKLRLGQHGDTCLENSGVNAPYVLVSSLFEGGAYRVQPGQRVSFQHGSLHEVVDEEKESCGCPAAEPKGNEFPEAQSAGLAPLEPAVPAAGKVVDLGPLTYSGADKAASAAAQAAANNSNTMAAKPSEHLPADKKPGIFTKIGGFFRRLFGAE